MDNLNQFVKPKTVDTEQEKINILNKINNYDFSFIIRGLGLSDYKIKVILTFKYLGLWLFEKDGTERVTIEYDFNHNHNVIKTYGVYEPQLVKDTLLLFKKVKNEVSYLSHSKQYEVDTISLFSKINEIISLYNDDNDNMINTILVENKNQIVLKYLDSVAVYDVLLRDNSINLVLNHSNNFKGIKTIQKLVNKINNVI